MIPQQRQVLADGTWFDPAQATHWTYEGYQQGTGHPFLQRLWRTKTGQYVFDGWAAHHPQGVLHLTSRERISPEQAASWLIACGYDIPPDLAPHAAAKEI